MGEARRLDRNAKGKEGGRRGDVALAVSQTKINLLRRQILDRLNVRLSENMNLLVIQLGNVLEVSVDPRGMVGRA